MVSDTKTRPQPVLVWRRANAERIEAHWGSTIPDPHLTQFAKDQHEDVAEHWSQPLPKTSGMIFGSSYFGFAQRTLSPLIPGEWSKYTYGLNPMILAGDTGDAWDDILDRAQMLAFSYAGDFLSDWLAQNNRDYIEKLSKKGTFLYGELEGYRFNHKIEDRGFLEFSYVDSAINGSLLNDKNKPLRVPFFENPKITETRSANYATHTIVNQNEPYRLWTSAKPAKLNVSFTITLPHLMSFARAQMQDVYTNIILSEQYSFSLLQDIKDRAGDRNDGKPINTTTLDYKEDRYKLTAKILKENLFELPTGHDTTQGKSDPTIRAQLVLYTVYLLNLIKSSVLGSSNNYNYNPQTGKVDDTTFDYAQTTWQAPEGHINPVDAIGGVSTAQYVPPPVIFLTHGALYQKAPFIATSYSLNFDGKAGYEELSLLPRKIDIKLVLESYDQMKGNSRTRGVAALFGHSGGESFTTGGGHMGFGDTGYL